MELKLVRLEAKVVQKKKKKKEREMIQIQSTQNHLFCFIAFFSHL